MLCSHPYSGGPQRYSLENTMYQHPFFNGPDAGLSLDGGGRPHGSDNCLNSPAASSDSFGSSMSAAHNMGGNTHPPLGTATGVNASQLPQVPMSMPMMDPLHSMQAGPGVDMSHYLQHGLGPGVDLNKMIGAGMDVSKMIDPNYLRAAATPEGLANMLANSQTLMNQALSNMAATGMPMPMPSMMPSPTGQGAPADSSDAHKRTRSSSLATAVVAPDGKKTQRADKGKDPSAAAPGSSRPVLPPPAEPTKEVKSHTARSLIRMLRAGTGVKTPNNIPIVEAEEVIKKLAGECAPVEILKTKKRNAGREALSVLLTMYLQKPVSMAEAALCFHNPTNRGLEPTTKLWELLGETRTWPPYPEAKAATPPANMLRQTPPPRQCTQAQPRLPPTSAAHQMNMIDPNLHQSSEPMASPSPFASQATTAAMPMPSPFAQDYMPTFTFDQMPVTTATSTEAPMDMLSAPMPAFMNQTMPTFTGGLPCGNMYMPQQMTTDSSYGMFGQMSSQGMSLTMQPNSRMDSTGWDSSPFGGAALQPLLPHSLHQQAATMPSPQGWRASNSSQEQSNGCDIPSPFSSPDVDQQTDGQPKVPSPTSQHRDASISGLFGAHLGLQGLEGVGPSDQPGDVAKTDGALRVPALSSSLSGFLPRDASLSAILATIDDGRKQSAPAQEANMMTALDETRTLGSLMSHDSRQFTWSGMFGSSQHVKSEDQ